MVESAPELHLPLEVVGGQCYRWLARGGERQEHARGDGHADHGAALVIDVGAQGAHAKR